MQSDKKENARATVILAGLCLLYVSLIIYLSYFEMIEAEKIEDHIANRRNRVEEESILRGGIYDRDGEVLAFSEWDEEGVQNRYWPQGDVFGHILGYNNPQLGKSALEKVYDLELLNISKSLEMNEIQKILKNEEDRYGNNLVLTVNTALQNKAYELLKGRKGTIILMNPTDGEVYAMASNPRYNPEKIMEDWAAINENPESPLLNRALTGLYAPGSTFKTMTATGVLEEMDPALNFDCKGFVEIESFKLKDYRETVHGNVDLANALRVSCNGYFATKALQLGDAGLRDLAKRNMIGEEIPFDLYMEPSRYNTEFMGRTEIASTAIGQGELLLTPMNMALMTSAIANDGKMVKPVLVKSIQYYSGKVKEDMISETISEVMTSEVAQKLKEMMALVVESGTGTGARTGSIKIAGKTGTAENPTGKDHAWFTGFAPVDNPKFAVVVLLEEAGTTGGTAAAPIARDIILEGVKRIQEN